MSIVLEVNSTKNCCRENKEILSEGLIDFLMKSDVGKAIRTKIQEMIVESILSMFLNITDETKKTNLYRILIRALGQVDYNDIIGVASGNEDACDAVSENVIVAIIKVMSETLQQEATQLLGVSEGGMASAIADTITTVGSAMDRILAERLKDSAELKKLSNIICNLDLMKIIKDNIPDIDLNPFDE
jgi:hypothetical protein